MATYNLSTTKTQSVALGANDTLNILRPGALIVTDSSAVTFGYGPEPRALNVLGTIVSYQYGVTANAYNFGPDAINVGAAGSIYGELGGIVMPGHGTTITNAGHVTSLSGYAIMGIGTLNNSGVIRTGSDVLHTAVAWSGTLNNSGDIVGGDFISVSGSGQLVNTGTIRGGVVQFGGTVHNEGSIIAADNSALTGSGTDIVINNGLIQGNPAFTFGAVRLHLGDDYFDTRNGTVLGGKVSGGQGRDILLGGPGSEHFAGDENNDKLNGGGGADTLDGGDGDDTFVLNGQASGSFTLLDNSGIDTILTTIGRDIRSYAFIENVVLQGGAAATLIGNAADNALLGNGANNMLAGQGGRDTLNGGGGNDDIFGQGGQDILIGGAGNDTFHYQSAADLPSGPLRDQVNDFDDGSDDRINLNLVYGPQLFFLGIGAFTAPGQVRINDTPDNHLIVQVNLDGNTATAELEIVLLNTTIGQIGADDFVLI